MSRKKSVRPNKDLNSESILSLLGLIRTMGFDEAPYLAWVLIKLVIYSTTPKLAFDFSRDNYA